MKRIHLFEFEDFQWFPNWLRMCMTRFIVAMHKILGTSPQLAELIAQALKHSETNRVIDMCSGSGGPMLEVAKILKEAHGIEDLQMSLSDLYPNQVAAQKINSNAENGVSYLTEPVDATNMAPDQKGVRTMVCSMHHMKPEIARAILKDAHDSREPIIIFEISDNSAPKWLWPIAIPINIIMTFFVTPLVRPMTIQQIVFTYFIPILPLLIAWDGAVSNARTYTVEDLDQLLVGLDSKSYSWKKGVIGGKARKLYLLGVPLSEN